MTGAASRPLVIAHRGASAYRPENTLGAYALAVEQRADMIEIDLHRTRDGAIVIAHDADLEHFGAKGEIATRTLEEMRALDAAHGWPDEKATVPTLEEVLDGYGARIALNLEIKGSRTGDYPGLEEAALAALAARGLGPSILFSSFRDTVLERLRAASADVRLATLVDPRWPAGAFERAAAVGAEAVNPHHRLVTEAFVARAHDEGLAVYPYTVDEADRMKRLIDAGVDGIFTNRPDRMRAIVDG